MANNWLSNTIAGIGGALNLPELGISEALASAPSTDPNDFTYSYKDGGVNYFQNYNGLLYPITREEYAAGTGADIAAIEAGNTGGGDTTGESEYGPTPTGTGGTSIGSGTSTNSDAYTPEDIAYLQGIKQDYLDQRGRLDTTLNQGNTRIADEYGREMDSANVGNTNQLNAYKGQRQSQTGIKGENYSQINNAANRGYSSLAAILGRASGTGSSAFQKLLPNIIGKDISSKRSQANNVFGKNMQGIDSAQSNYETSFQEVLEDLARQKRENEENLLNNVNTQRGTLASRLGTVEGQLAAAAGGGAAEIRAAQDPYTREVVDSRNAIDNLFNTYFKPYTPKVANAPAPELSNYTMDRSQINAGNQGAVDASNPYAQLLRKKLQGQA